MQSIYSVSVLVYVTLQMTFPHQLDSSQHTRRCRNSYKNNPHQIDTITTPEFKWCQLSLLMQ